MGWRNQGDGHVVGVAEVFGVPKRCVQAERVGEAILAEERRVRTGVGERLVAERLGRSAAPNTRRDKVDVGVFDRANASLETRDGVLAEEVRELHVTAVVSVEVSEVARLEVTVVAERDGRKRHRELVGARNPGLAVRNHLSSAWAITLSY